MSQITRATFPPSSSYGSTRNVSRSGFSTMSDSSMRTNPSIELPSNMMSPSSAFSNWLAGTSTFLLMPRMSVNCSRKNATSRSLASVRMSALEAPVVFSGMTVGDGRPFTYPPQPSSTVSYRPPLAVVIQEKLVRVRPQGDRIDLLRPLVAKPRIDQILREHAALQQERMVGLERRERLGEASRRVLDVLPLRRLELVEVHVHRLRRLDLVAQPVQPRHQQRGEGEVGIARRIGCTELDPLRLR